MSSQQTVTVIVKSTDSQLDPYHVVSILALPLSKRLLRVGGDRVQEPREEVI